MSSNAFAQPLRIRPRPSLRLASFLVLAHGGTLLLLWTLAVATGLKLAVAALVLLDMLHGWRRHVRRSGAGVVDEVILQTGGQWLLQFPGREPLPAGLLPDSYVHPWLIVLRFRHRDGCCSLVLLPDMIDRDCHRRLRVRLAMERDRLFAGGEAG